MRAEIKVGVMVPTSGSEATYGQDMENAIKMAVDDVNAKGGVLGQKIVTFTADDGCDPQMATAAASKLVSNEMTAILGGYCSGATLPTLKIYADAGIPFIVCSANSSKFTTLNPGHAFLINSLATFQVDTAMKLFKKIGAKKIAIVHQGDGYSEDLASLTRTKWEQEGNQVVAYEMVTKGEQDQSSLVTRIKSKNPDMVFWTAYYADGALLIKQLRQGGYKGKITVGDGSTDPHLIEIGGKATEGVYALSNPLPKFLPKGAEFISKYRARFHAEAGPYSALTYDGTMLLVDALKRAGSTDHAKLTAAIKATKNFPGLSGPITFDEHNNLALSNFQMLVVQNGDWQLAK
ncbi:MAG: branched-chain amino acid ABC transporter substrate-binding protein [Holophaga sp.]|jgi:branched-chain amino acid transport system substrate-binding protein